MGYFCPLLLQLGFPKARCLWGLPAYPAAEQSARSAVMKLPLSQLLHRKARPNQE